uniref:hypothetical protein n=1 Tax=Alistipes finegoldii TaxID=214856 RepID=UPI001E2911EC
MEEMAQYITSILKSAPQIVMSWGYHQPSVYKEDGMVKCTPNIGRISICLDGMSSVLYRAHV